MMTFVALNNLAAPISKISFELAFFNDKNAVDRVTVLDFRDLPQGKKRVRQFDMTAAATARRSSPVSSN